MAGFVVDRWRPVAMTREHPWIRFWLASFPRSGNTFFRIVLDEVYGLGSSQYHRQPEYPVQSDYDRYPVIKTHLLPSELVPADPAIPAICIVRDGRDALVSMAHQRCDMIAPGSDFYQNLREAIVAEGGSFFGGWSANVNAWLQRASVVVRFEELVGDPVACMERLRSVVELPAPDVARLPTFSDLRSRLYRYGCGSDRGVDATQRERLLPYFFRRGKLNSWREDMPDDLHELYWELHGDMMNRLDYDRAGGRAVARYAAAVTGKTEREGS